MAYTERVDIAIIGGGPAGIFAGALLGTIYSVAIVERRNREFVKPCGGLCTRRALQYLSPFEPPEWIYATPKSSAIHLVDLENREEEAVKQETYNIRRGHLERWLRSLLSRQSVFYEHTIVQSIRSKGGGYELLLSHDHGGRSVLRASVVLGADGVRSETRALLGLPPANSVQTVQYRVNNYAELDHIEFLFDSTITGDFYIWVIPKDETLLIGTRHDLEHREAFEELIARRYDISLPKAIDKREGYPLTRVSSVDEICWGRERILLLGEAAGLVMPAFGEGLTSAFESAYMASMAIRRSFADPLPEYEKEGQQILARIDRETSIFPLMGNALTRHLVFKL